MFETELIADRMWRERAQLELVIGEWVGWSRTCRGRAALASLETN